MEVVVVMGVVVVARPVPQLLGVVVATVDAEAQPRVLLLLAVVRLQAVGVVVTAVAEAQPPVVRLLLAVVRLPRVAAVLLQHRPGLANLRKASS